MLKNSYNARHASPNPTAPTSSSPTAIAGIVPPGASGKKITVRACDADGVQSGPVKKVPAKELRLEPLPVRPAPLRLAPWCVNCGSPAMMRCMACGSSICGRECAEKRWKQHRPECRRLQAVAFGEEYAREEDRSYRLTYAAHSGDCLLYTSDAADDLTRVDLGGGC